MAQRKLKAVFTADPEQLSHIQALVRSHRYPTLSEFMREAIDDKLATLQAERLTEQVARYCAAGSTAEDDEWIDAQAFDEEP